MNRWLAAAPESQVAHGARGCEISLNDLCDRPPRALADGEVLDIGGKRVRHIDTPHVPHGWEARVLYEETTNTLLCGDLFAHVDGRVALTESDLVEPAMVAEEIFQASSLAPHTGATLRKLADLSPSTLAMHGSSFTGDGRQALRIWRSGTTSSSRRRRTGSRRFRPLRCSGGTAAARRHRAGPADRGVWRAVDMTRACGKRPLGIGGGGETRVRRGLPAHRSSEGSLAATHRLTHLHHTSVKAAPM